METPPGSVAMETPGSPAGGAPGWQLRRGRRRHALLALVGEVGSEAERQALRGTLQRGICSWDINLQSCDLNLQLKLFVTRHLAHFSSEVKVPTNCSNGKPPSKQASKRGGTILSAHTSGFMQAHMALCHHHFYKHKLLVLTGTLEARAINMLLTRSSSFKKQGGAAISSLL